MTTVILDSASAALDGETSWCQLARSCSGSVGPVHEGMTRGFVTRFRRAPVAHYSRAAGSTARVVLPVLGCYALMCAAIYAAQQKMLYFPLSERPIHPRQHSRVFSDIQEVETTAVDGTRCLSWHWPAPSLGAAPARAYWMELEVHC